MRVEVQVQLGYTMHTYVILLMCCIVSKAFFVVKQNPVNGPIQYFCVTNSSLPISWIDSSNRKTYQQASEFIPNKNNNNLFWNLKTSLPEKYWSIENSLNGNISQIILDRRWENMTVEKTYELTDFGNKLKFLPVLTELKRNFVIPFSVKAEHAHMFLCDGAEVWQSNCYWFLLQVPTWPSLSKITAIRKCMRGSLSQNKGDKVKLPCANNLRKTLHTLKEPEYLDTNRWCHFTLKKNGNILCFSQVRESGEKEVLRFSEPNIFNVTHMIIHTKNYHKVKNGLWKIHQLNYMYTNNTVDKIRLGPIITTSNNFICISMFVTMCPSCELILTISNNEDPRQMIFQRKYTQKSKWAEIKLFQDNINFNEVILLVSTINKDHTRGFWAVDSIRQCQKDEFRVISSPQRKECQLVSHNEDLLYQEQSEVKTYCLEDTISHYCVPCSWFSNNCDQLSVYEKVCPEGKYGASCSHICGNKCRTCNKLDGTCNPKTTVFVTNPPNIPSLADNSRIFPLNHTATSKNVTNELKVAHDLYTEGASENNTISPPKIPSLADNSRRFPPNHTATSKKFTNELKLPHDLHTEWILENNTISPPYIPNLADNSRTFPRNHTATAKSFTNELEVTHDFHTKWTEENNTIRTPNIPSFADNSRIFPPDRTAKIIDKSSNRYEERRTLMAIVVIIIITILLLTGIIILILLMRYRRLNSSTTETINDYQINENEMQLMSLSEEKLNHQIISSKPIEKNYFQKNGKEIIKINGLRSQYMAIINIISNKVFYQEITDDLNYDYINMQFKDCTIEKAYLITGVPKFDDINIFWGIIWDENIKNIIMLDNIYNKQKTEIYWNDDKNENLRFSEISVQLCFCEFFANYEYRKFIIVKGNETRHVDQLRYVSWFHNEEFIDYVDLVPFFRRMSNIRLSTDSPIMIHGRNGTKKTGFALLCDMCLRLAKTEGVFNILAICQKLIDNSNVIIDNFEQYIMAHLVIYEVLFGTNTSINCNSGYMRFKNKYNENEVQNQILYLKTTLWLDQIVQTIKIKRETELYFRINVRQDQIVLNRTERKKNISQLMVIDGFRHPHKFIVTQQPTSDSLSDFWKTITEKNIFVVIFLNEITYYNYRIDQNNTVLPKCKFWPCKKNRIMKPSKGIIVEYKSERSFQSYDLLTVTVELYSNKINVNFQVEIILLKDWFPSLNCPPNILNFITFCSESKQISKRSNQVLLTCYDGIKACGLYLVMMYNIEKMKQEETSDICTAVRIFRQHSLEFINDEQYSFLCKAAVVFMNESSLYENLNQT